METNEEKLRVLLQIAVENGWDDKDDFVGVMDYYEVLTKQCLLYDDNHDIGVCYSLNDLISNWERSEISFVEALLNAWFHKQLDETKSVAFEKPIILMDDDGIKREIYYITHLTPSYIRFYWNEKPTSQRLNWLFEIFNYLL